MCLFWIRPTFTQHKLFISHTLLWEIINLESILSDESEIERVVFTVGMGIYMKFLSLPLGVLNKKSYIKYQLSEGFKLTLGMSLGYIL